MAVYIVKLVVHWTWSRDHAPAIYRRFHKTRQVASLRSSQSGKVRARSVVRTQPKKIKGLGTTWSEIMGPPHVV